eukprot:TRINITY_DN2663_c0_g1_i4.p1 TRINITY_DN2663_c0_g1~~TRINITY_DN2663_c0_g1_i4.p1  ORF type:complete len:947 (-),score=277.56 TRINITY_DN2663_c0_g1_i4:38-2878(-)
MEVCNNRICMALSRPRIIRLDLDAPEDLEDIEISRRPTDVIHRIFLDPGGNHLLISFAHKENYYLHSSWKKPRLLKSMRGVLVESVAWDVQNVDNNSSGNILLGADGGRIFETNLDARAGGEKFWKPVFNMNNDVIVCGLRFERFPVTPAEPKKFFVTATTPTRMYQFIGGPDFEELFRAYQSTHISFLELIGDVDRSELHFWRHRNDSIAQSFAWLADPGIYHGDLVFGSQNTGDAVMTETQLISDQVAPKPLSLVLTEFHFLLLYPDRFIAISRLSGEVVQSIRLPVSGKDTGRVCGMTHDPQNNTVWVFSEYSVWEVEVNEENRDVWELYLHKGQYDLALRNCSDQGQKDKVWSAQADRYYHQKNFELAASFYGKTMRSFEEVALKFLSINESDALKSYLVHKLENLGKRDSTQRTLICTWLTEIYLQKLNMATDAKDDTKGNRMHRNAGLLREELHQFLVSNRDHLDDATTYSLIDSHGCIEEMLFYATLIEDWERVISHHIQHRNFALALDGMAKQPHEQIYYKFSPVLMHELPYETVNQWMRASFLNPRDLIPSLMKYDSAKNPHNEKQNQAIRYLQYCVNKLDNTDSAIHNYLLSLYAQNDDQTALLNFLSTKESYFDLKYALRLCTLHDKALACVLIYSKMELYEEAVELALKVDLDLAKINADKPEDDDELRKKLWLRIARHVVEEEKDIKKAMAFLSQCDLLKIEDILPFFSDFVLIDDFKDEICRSLEDYNQHIEELIEEMDDATNSANLIRQDIKELRNKFGVVTATQKCDICKFNILTRQFYLFPCQHVFHADCLSGEMLKHLNKVQCQRVRELQDSISREYVKKAQRSGAGNAPPVPPVVSASSSLASMAGNLLTSAGIVSGETAAPLAKPAQPSMPQLGGMMDPMERLKIDLDELVASECPLCGTIMLKSIEAPFVVENEDAHEIESWAID